MKQTIDGIDYNTDQATWVARVENGGKVASILYQRPKALGGEYFFHHLSSDAIEPITEFEARRLMQDLVESARIAEVTARAEQAFADLGIEFDPSVAEKVREQIRAQIRDRIHKEAHQRGLVRSSGPNLRKLLGSTKGADR